jgi:putative transposase
VTRHPTDAWVAQQLREATPNGARPRFLVRDNDGKYGAAFARIAAATGIAELRTAYRAPRQNACVDRKVHPPPDQRWVSPDQLVNKQL